VGQHFKVKQKYLSYLLWVCSSQMTNWRVSGVTVYMENVQCTPIRCTESKYANGASYSPDGFHGKSIHQHEAMQNMKCVLYNRIRVDK